MTGRLIIIVAVILILAGCGRAAEQPVQDSEPVTLRFGVPFQASNDDPLLVQAIERFEQENPRISVEIVIPSRIPTFFLEPGMIEALQLDAVLWSPDPGLLLREQPLVLNLEPSIGNEEGFAEQDFLPHTLDAFRWQGQRYGIPARVETALMYYNRDLFDAQGVAYPRSDWNWEDLLSTAQQLTTVRTSTSVGEGEQQSGHWGFVAHHFEGEVFLFVWQHGGRLLDDPLKPTRPVFDDPLVPEAIQWYADLGLVHHVMPIVQWDKVDALSRLPTDAFALQKAAMMVGGIASRGGDVIPWNFAWGAVPLPRDQTRASSLFVQGYFVMARSEHPQEAWALVHSLSKSESEVTSLIPARRAVAESAAFRQRVGTEVAEAALSTLEGDTLLWVFDQRFSDWVRGFVTQTYSVSHGDITADVMMDRLRDQFADFSVEQP
ncbi:MAG TPA: extracellular solute-binding protein [Anaerolineae bacterium]|nr:extracellular solute-binding protein [Anaerolineae bacterium]